MNDDLSARSSVVKKRKRKIGLVFLAVFLFLGLWAFLFEPGFGHHVRSHHLKVKGWMREDYKIILLADLHIGSPFNGLSKLERIVEMTNSQEPDLILIAGDFVIQGVLGGDFVAPEAMTSVLARLKAKEGVYAVLGNHDHWHDAVEMTEALESAGIPVLTNKVIEKNGFWLAGVDDIWAGKPELEKTLAQVTDQKPILLLTHNPDLFVKVPESVALTIAGHTHGGQVYFPFIGRPVVPSDYGERFAIGSIIEDQKQMFVNPGTGTSILPVRFLVPPEISLLKIRAR